MRGSEARDSRRRADLGRGSDFRDADYCGVLGVGGIHEVCQFRRGEVCRVPLEEPDVARGVSLLVP